MKIVIDFEDLENVALTIDGKVLTIERDGPVSRLNGLPNGGDEDSLGAIIATGLMEKIDEIACAMESLAWDYSGDPWEQLTEEAAEEVRDQLI